MIGRQEVKEECDSNFTAGLKTQTEGKFTANYNTDDKHAVELAPL